MRFNMASNSTIPTPPTVVTVGCTMLAGTNKQGILKPSQDGYYTLVVGSYGTNNSAGMFYDEASGVAMFHPDSSLMRRLKKGVLFAEFKHPEPFQDLLIQGKAVRAPMSDSQYLMRIRQIDDNRVCAHIRSLSIIAGTNENGQPVKLVVAELKPYGPFKNVLQDSLDNPSINTYFSVRSITQDDLSRGIKYTREISTWDFVGEGGIFTANKYNSPALESFTESERIITPDVLWAVEDEARKRANIGLECAGSDVAELAKTLGWERKALTRKPNWLR